MANRALCVGINDYPGSNMDLAGCVNDAKRLAGAPGARGYHVDAPSRRRGDPRAHRRGLEAAIGQAAEGDSLVFTFSGHGSWLPDDDRDEPDARDEMMCPYDVMKEQYLLDDDLHEIFCTKAPGARLYVIADCCHSGSVVRYASAPARAGPRTDEGAVSSAVRVRARRTACSSARSIARSNTPAPTKLRYPALLFSGCQDTEFSYDTSFNGRPNGAFTRTAIDALQDAAITTPRALHDAIRKALPSQALPQTPQLFGKPRGANWAGCSDG